MRTQARQVLIGGGVAGCSLPYRLASLGRRDTLTVGTSVGLACLPTGLSTVGTRLDAEILGKRRGASVVGAPLYDPEGGRMRG